MPAPADLRGRSLLAVFAHPDDESIACGGLLAWCAHLGADVALLCMTRGEHGRNAGSAGRTRSRELRAAARTLGIGALTLLDHEDGMLPWLSADTLRSAIARAIRARRPEVVVTFDADGLYWHPDHVAVHELTTAAIVALGAAAPALYYVTTPPGAMRRVAEHAARASSWMPTSPVQPGAMRRVAEHAARTRRRRGPEETPAPCRGDGPGGEEGGDRQPRPADAGGAARPRPRAGAGRPPPASILGVADPDAFGASAPAPTLVVDAGDFATAKLRALSCHASQFEGSALSFVTERDAPLLLGVEHYRRAAAGAPGRTFLDDLGARPGAPDGPPGHGGAPRTSSTTRSSRPESPDEPRAAGAPGRTFLDDLGTRPGAPDGPRGRGGAPGTAARRP